MFKSSVSTRSGVKGRITVNGQKTDKIGNSFLKVMHHLLVSFQKLTIL